MKTEVLRALRASAAAWWRHKELRRSDQVDLARKLERATIQRDLDHLRLATTLPQAHIICSRRSTSLHLGWTTVSTAAPIERFPLAALAVDLGTPFIDLRPISDLVSLLALPRVDPEETTDPAHAGLSSKVSLSTYLDLVESLGARILNDPRDHQS